MQALTDGGWQGRERAPGSLLARRLDRSTVFLCLSIVLLNLVDAFATLHHLAYGAEELNPLMRALISHGALAFLLGKHLLASAGVIGIALYPGPRASRLALAVLFPIYLALAGYQLCLFCVL